MCQVKITRLAVSKVVHLFYKSTFGKDGTARLHEVLEVTEKDVNCHIIHVHKYLCLDGKMRRLL